MTDDRMQRLATRLLEARRAHTTLDTLDEALVPESKDQAYVAQHITIAALGGAGGYKIGASTPEAEPQCSPLPANAIFDDGVMLPFKASAIVGLELEIAFRFGDAIDASFAALDDAAILARIATVHVTSEIVASRFTNRNAISKLAQLADLQNNGALIVGQGVPYRADIEFVAPRVEFRAGDQTIFSGVARNPCGDPRRVVVWLVRDALARGRTIGAGQILTAGSYTGCRAIDSPGAVHGVIEGIGKVDYTLA
ncbi:2-keto-4-pentenoate hydratase [Pararobbsia silviterrae]|uniref:2-keto-4-pentenoate hydratase n=1 Tax=Pararobbsia silviterrae TaxID=1792498 RepID=A0A494Y8M4_9BURK|nr:2-keto-4-pentenoate hydratase [Pararobbsia silviterrae]RKP56656.1 2-keto-4-pentenoate hydratase [Pararobbsia silviterrae]